MVLASTCMRATHVNACTRRAARHLLVLEEEPFTSLAGAELPSLGFVETLTWPPPLS